MRIMTRQAVLAGVVALVPIAAAQATVYFDNQFETEVVNTADNVPTAGYNVGRGAVITGSYNVAGGMTKPTSADGSTTTGGRKATVFGASQSATTGFTTQSVGLFSHAFGDAGEVKIEATPGQNDPLAGTTSGKYVFSFGMSVTKTDLDTSGWTEKPGIQLRTNYWDTTHTITGFNPVLSVSESMGNITVSSSTGIAGGTAMTTNIVTGLTVNTAYDIATTLDMDTRTFTLSVNGAQVGGTFYQLVAGAPGLGLGEYLAVGGKPANTSGVEGFFHYYDNVSLQSVPEPVSLSGLGLGAMLLLRRRANRA